MSKRKQSLGRATRNAKRMKSRAKNPDIQTRDVSPTHQQQLPQAYKYVEQTIFGRPDLFITTATNPKWQETVINLLPQQSASDRPDIVVRAFNQKMKKLMSLINDSWFGHVQAWLYSIEFQKRGLPLAHILVWLSPESKISPQNIDLLLSAEIPSPNTEPVLHELVTSDMIKRGPIVFNLQRLFYSNFKIFLPFVKNSKVLLN